MAVNAVEAALPILPSRDGMLNNACKPLVIEPKAMFNCRAPLMTPPMMTRAGPRAATKAKTATTTVWTAGSSPVNQFTASSSACTTLRRNGSRFFISVIAIASKEPVNCSTSFLRLSCMTDAVSSATPPQLSIEDASASYSSWLMLRSDIMPERPVLPASTDA